MKAGWNQLVWTLLAVGAAASITGCQTSEGVTWPAFGTYRLPYVDGTEVKVKQDFETHTPVGRYDLVGQGGGPYGIAAAADGWIRFIVDDNDGHGTGDNNYVWIEHPYPFCQPAGVTWSGKPADYDATCIPCQGEFCNEWTKYSHMSEDSVTVEAGLVEGQFVPAGTFLGWEDDIGHAHGKHVHFEAAKLDPDNPLSSYANGWTHDWSDDGWAGSPNLLVSICKAGVLKAGDVDVAEACPGAGAAAAEVVKTKLQWSSPWTASVRGSRGIVAELDLLLDRSTRSDRLTFENLRLAKPLAFVVRRDGIFAWPIGTKVELRDVRLVRPTTLAIDRRGRGRLGESELILTMQLVVAEPGRPPVRTQLTTPLQAEMDVLLKRKTLQLTMRLPGVGGLRGTARTTAPRRK